MQTGRFVNKLENDVLVYYQTEGVENLLRKENLAEVWNLSKEPADTYERFFPNDMAITLTKITLAADSSGRIIHENDTVIKKFNGSDAETILRVLNEHLDVLGKMKVCQANDGQALQNPLPVPEV